MWDVHRAISFGKLVSEFYYQTVPCDRSGWLTIQLFRGVVKWLSCTHTYTHTSPSVVVRTQCFPWTPYPGLTPTLHLILALAYYQVLTLSPYSHTTSLFMIHNHVFILSMFELSLVSVFVISGVWFFSYKQWRDPSLAKLSNELRQQPRVHL